MKHKLKLADRQFRRQHFSVEIKRLFYLFVYSRKEISANLNSRKICLDQMYAVQLSSVVLFFMNFFKIACNLYTNSCQLFKLS